MCSLFVNGLVGGSSLLPFLLPQLSSRTHRVSLTSCGLQMFLMYTYSSVEFFNLAAMAYDRYVAICFPLSYRRRLCPRAVGTVLALVWGNSLSLGAFVATLVTSVKFCRSRIHKIYCNYYDLGSLVCADDAFVGPSIKVVELLYMSTALLGMVAFIVFTYVRILMVCFRGSRQTRQKAVSTCAPHLASLTNYGLGLFLEESQTKFDIQNISRVFQVFLSLYIVVGPPLLNALLYGLNMSQLRAVCKGLLAPKNI
ncbi:olfactory receptor 10H4-like [Boleophthalmus pectinirostris]|uniref:olfactory receptor 10H4-like n=1 Tax=Boleophthalmus pectinirostris TaxID=150288 RepID=UPI0024331EDB|nr:olfactory receptor 10H4-like [Boleophthalmus pectinirostris]